MDGQGHLPAESPDDGKTAQMPRSAKLLRAGAHAAIGLAWVAFLVAMIWGGLHYQWDLRVLYYASQAWVSGLDPYNVESLQQFGGERQQLAFFYPLITLYGLGLLTVFSYETAWFVWLGLKLAALGGLVAVWRRVFLPDVDGLLLSVAVFLGFNATVLCDIFSGNKVIFEQLVLWLGFAAYVQGRLWPFGAATAIASVWNATPAAFLALLLAPKQRRHGGLLIAASAAGLLLVLLLGPFVLHPQWLHSIIHGASTVRETGMSNPCMLAFADQCARMFPTSLGEVADLPRLLWLVYAAVIVGFSVRPLRWAMASGDSAYLVMLAVVVYAVLMPRMKCYSYILLIPPALVAIHRAFPRLPQRLAAVAVLCLPIRVLFEDSLGGGGALLPTESPVGLLVHYSWLLALMLWWLYVSGRVGPVVSESGRSEAAVVE